MKKAFCAIMVLLVLASGALTGCTSSEPFDKDVVVSAASLYGVKSFNNSNAYSVVGSISGKYGQSGYYVSQSAAEAQYIYNDYINANSYYPSATINEIVVIAVKEQVVTAMYDTDCCVIYFNDSSSAKDYFDAYKEMLKSDNKNKTGYKDGYAYAITYSLTANRDGNCDWMKGVYLKGNSVLIISGFSPIGIADTFSDYIYDELNVIDPATLND